MQNSFKDLLQQLHVTVEDLAALDNSLISLFKGAPNTDVTEHQQLVQVCNMTVFFCFLR